MSDERVVRTINDSRGKFTHMFFCPGCRCGHGFNGTTWQFNGDLDKPTLHPSYLTKWNHEGQEHVCHSYVRGGTIQFLNDCTHALKGQTVPLAPF